MSVLIVDDELPIRDSIRDALEDEGHRTMVAADGFEALEHLKANDDIDALIVDLLMPRMNGIELLKTISTVPELAEIPVIIVTSDPSHAPAGHTVLRKPVRLEAILDTVKRVVAARHAGRGGEA
ncbi:MAG: response regulator [Myxococcaceae bacterium]